MTVTTVVRVFKSLLWTALAMLASSAVGYVESQGTAPIEKATENIRLTLSSQTVWQGEYGWCAFSAEILHQKGGLSYRCGGAGPFGTAAPGAGAGSVRRRALADSEVTELRRLYEAATLFDGGHIGADLSASDLPFHILIVRATTRGQPAGNPAVALVTTGNPTFSSGPRKALSDWLTKQRYLLSR